MRDDKALITAHADAQPDVPLHAEQVAGEKAAGRTDEPSETACGERTCHFGRGIDIALEAAFAVQRGVNHPAEVS